VVFVVYPVCGNIANNQTQTTRSNLFPHSTSMDKLFISLFFRSAFHSLYQFAFPLGFYLFSFPFGMIKCWNKFYSPRSNNRSLMRPWEFYMMHHSERDGNLCWIRGTLHQPRQLTVIEVVLTEISKYIQIFSVFKPVVLCSTYLTITQLRSFSGG
jgi:hypothetical protein